MLNLYGLPFGANKCTFVLETSITLNDVKKKIIITNKQIKVFAGMYPKHIKMTSIIVFNDSHLTQKGTQTENLNTRR